MREIVARKNEEGEHDELRTLPVAFDILVRSPADTLGYPYTDAIRSQADYEVTQSEFSSLRRALFERFECCIRFSGNSPSFNVVVMVDSQLAAIRKLVEQSGASLPESEIRVLDIPRRSRVERNHLGMQLPQERGQEYKRLERKIPVQTEFQPIIEVAPLPASEMPPQLQAAGDLETDSDPIIGAFIAELIDILQRGPVDPHLLDLLLAQARDAMDHAQNPSPNAHPALLRIMDRIIAASRSDASTAA